MLSRYVRVCCLLLVSGPALAVDGKAGTDADTDNQTATVEVAFSGIGGEMLDNVRAGVSLNRERDRALTEARIRFLHRRAADEIRSALKVFGYYDPAIDARLARTGTGWRAEYEIDPGRAVVIREIDINFTGSGAESEAFRELLADHPFAEGQRLEHQTYTAYKNRIERRALELGYFDARFITRQMRVDPDNHRATIHLSYDTGPRYHYGPVTFSESPLSDDFLHNYIPFESGDPYESSSAQALRRALIDSDMFSSVDVRPDETAGKEHEVPVAVGLEARKPNRYTAGIGFATDTGPRLRLGWAARYLNERGHQANVDLRLSTVTSTLSGTYLMPYFLDRQADVGLRTSLKNEDTDTSRSRSGQASVFQNSRRWGWNETLSATILVENFTVADDSDTSKLLIPGASWWKSWSDDAVYAQHGGRLQFDIRGAAESMLSDISFVQTRIQGRYVRALGWRNRILTRFDFGMTEVSDFERLPASLRFFAGGDNSIRGFDYQSLGPTNDAGDVTGGRYLMVGSVEYEQFVYKDYGVAAFVDFGNAMNSLSDPIEVGTGVGLRWLSPVGMIKFDVAAGVSRDDVPIRLHISLGADL